MADALRAFVRFWIDFIVGDDPMIAGFVALGLTASWALVTAEMPAWWLLPAVVIAAVLISLRRAIARGG